MNLTRFSTRPLAPVSVVFVILQLPRLFRLAMVVTAAVLLSLVTSPGSIAPAFAANSLCGSVVGGVVNCQDVGVDGVHYDNDATTINITGGASGTSVTSGKAGIYLRQSGGSSNGATNVDFTTTTTTVQINSKDTTVLALPGVGGANPTPIKVGSALDYIVVGEDSNHNATYSVGGVGKTTTELAQLLAATPGSAGAATGNLTVNNPAANGTAASFSTSSADGIHVESTGGAGGNGGCVNLLLVSWCDDGDSGGAAGSVAVNNDGTITATGGYGVSATSIGGQGGDGGGTFGAIFSSPGGGGAGGNGAGVTIDLGPGSMIETFGAGAHGVYAVSQGGNGGTGGTADAAIALGDDGGHGGSAGAVSITNQGSITTHGDGADGIYGASKGAGAGSGSGSGGIVAIGGNGGGESSGSTVTVNSSGVIATKGLNSFGIFAESVGGGGGDGGNAGGLFSVGGQAGSGGGAGTVTVNVTGTVTTDKAGSTALFAQSVGGGGGNGGNATAVSAGASVAIGGNGGLGGAGGKVVINDLGAYNGDVSNLPPLTVGTMGDRANGIQAQSIGGGGGNGGFALSVAVPLGGVSASFAIGGNGGGGGNADTVEVNENGGIGTSGNQSIGIFAQSVGGGGGNGGGTVAAAVGGVYNLGLAIGGSGGTARDGNVVSVDALGSITTTGAGSYGILAQSVGGGGGNGGFAVSGTVGSFAGSLALGGSGGGGGAGKDVTVTSGATISTSGAGAVGVLAQSVGGGGGNGGLSGSLAVGGGSLAISLGGSGGAASTAGLVTVTNNGAITTTGNNAAGVLAQSVGGGGGNGGMALALNGAMAGGAVGLGGSGAAGSDGGAVNVHNFGKIVTGVAGNAQTDLAPVGTDSYGIFAQSVGGGGGDGGMAIAGSLGISALPEVPSVAIAVSVGGKGGGASNGQKVTVDNAGSIETYGLGASAIYAQSVGGGGGNGGLAGSVAVSVGDSQSGAIGVAVGGKASGGGDAGEVDVGNGAVDTDGNVILAADPLAKIITNAVGADGIHAQSVGGGGGDGGYALAGSFSFGGEAAVSASVAIGGKGGAGGKGSIVNVVNTALIETLGNHADGVFAQSVGGGGGDGGMAITGTMSFSESAGAVGVTVGGGGGTASTGGHVTVDNYGTITTAGDDSTGIFAQSIGGTGGTGGLSLGIQALASTQNGASIGVTVGGSGGSGNAGGQVDVTNHAGATIITTGQSADGIKAQSVGGGGGDGGLAATAQIGVALGSEDQANKSLNVGVTLGGNGGAGGIGGIVNVTNDGKIDVSGLSSIGLFAQSVGGGGGDAGAAVTAIGLVTDSQNDKSRSVSVNVAVGGVGGSGNIGGAVNVANSGTITTTSGSGYGIFAQSVGGGGGIGGRANALTIAATEKCSLPVVCTGPKSNSNNMSASFAVGGNGGTGGNGGVVTVDNTGGIETIGDASDGIYAQSIGAGGGNGGNGILGSGEILPVPLETAALPFGSVPFYKNLSVAVGGNSGATGDGKDVEVDNSGNITTHGSNSNGVTLESVGGGGGIGGRAAIGITGIVGVGGKGGAGGNGGDVTFGAVNANNVDNTDNHLASGDIETFGASSDGIFAQSIGGGGGLAGNVDRLLPNGLGPISTINFGIGLAFGQGGGSGGNGGLVTVDPNGTIRTHGDDATGIFAQSVGGGGGVQGTLGNDIPVADLLSWHVGSNGDIGNGGVVNVNLAGNIYTSGNGANGIFAQSSGGKTNGTTIAGTGGDVSITVAGSVVTGAADPQRGLGSVAILAQSVGGGGNGNITVDVNSLTDVVQGGRTGTIAGATYATADSDVLQTAPDQAVTGIGVEILDGKNNAINNHGTITTVDGVNAGYAIYATGSNMSGLAVDNDASSATFRTLVAAPGTAEAGGNETVSNYGTVTGSIDLGAGINSFNNLSSGVFNSGKIANVGALNTITNDGLMSPGGVGIVMETAITGNLSQSITGTYGTDVDFRQFGVSGALPTDLYTATGNLNMAGIVNLNLLNIGTVKPGEHSSVIAQSTTGTFSGNDLTLYALQSAVASYTLEHSNTDLSLDYNVDFAPKGLTPNETSLGEYINAVQTDGGSVALEPAIQGLFTIATLDDYAKALDELTPEPYLANDIAAMMSTLTFENRLMSCKVENGVAKFSAEGQCAWAALDGTKSVQQPTDEHPSGTADAAGLAAGFQNKVSDVMRVGGAFSWDAVANTSGKSTSIGNIVETAGVVKAQLGDTVLAAALIGGYGDLDVTRNVDALNGPIYTLKGTQQIALLSGHFRASHAFANDNFYVRPSVDLGVSETHSFAVQERGGPVALAIEANDQLTVTVEPALELGGEIGLGDSAVMRPFARLGLIDTVLGANPTATASFIGAPTAVDGFTVAGGSDQYMLDMELGADLIQAEGLAVRLTGGARIGKSTTSYGGGLKLSAPF
jgi:hypothetical protein